MARNLSESESGRNVGILAAVTDSTFKRCPNCGGPTEFSPTRQCLACSFCRAEGPIAAQPRVNEVPIEQADTTRVVTNSELRTARCSNCGASEAIPVTTAATRCAFCTNPLVVDGATPTRVPSDNVVPFRIDKKGAESAFTSWLAGLWFRPNDLKTAARLDHIRGVYIPSWVFSAQAHSDWRAEAGYHYYENETVYVDGKAQQRQVQKTRWEPAWGVHDTAYLDLVVEASKGLTEDELQSLEPYDLTNPMVRYQDDYLAGFEAECLSSTAMQAFQHGHKRIEGMERSACAQLVPGDTHRSLQVATRSYNVTAASTLVPVYVAAYIYADKVFRLLVNGQSAKVSGKAPWSWVKITFAILAVVLVIAIIALASR